MFSLSMFGPFRCSVFRCSVLFEVRSFDIQSFDVRSHSTFSLSMFGPIRGLVFRCSVLFDVRSFEVWSFNVQSFEVRSFEVRSFEVRSRFRGDVAGQPSLDKPRRYHSPGGKPPRMWNIVKMEKNVFSEFLGDNGAKNAYWNIASEALGACWAEGQLERWTAEQELRFCPAVLLGGRSFKIDWICSRQGGDCFSGLQWGRGGVRQKSATMSFSQGRYNICTEIKAKWRC